MILLSNENLLIFRLEATTGPKPKLVTQQKERIGYRLSMWLLEMLALLVKNLQLKLDPFASKPLNSKTSELKSFDNDAIAF